MAVLTTTPRRQPDANGSNSPASSSPPLSSPLSSSSSTAGARRPPRTNDAVLTALLGVLLMMCGVAVSPVAGLGAGVFDDFVPSPPPLAPPWPPIWWLQPLPEAPARGGGPSTGVIACIAVVVTLVVLAIFAVALCMCIRSKLRLVQQYRAQEKQDERHAAHIISMYGATAAAAARVRAEEDEKRRAAAGAGAGAATTPDHCAAACASDTDSTADGSRCTAPTAAASDDGGLRKSSVAMGGGGAAAVASRPSTGKPRASGDAAPVATKPTAAIQVEMAQAPTPPPLAPPSTLATLAAPQLARRTPQEAEQTAGQAQAQEEPLHKVYGDNDGDCCVLCLEAPKQVALGHGDSVHVCACKACAQKLAIGSPCPMCRAPIHFFYAAY